MAGWRNDNLMEDKAGFGRELHQEIYKTGKQNKIPIQKFNIIYNLENKKYHKQVFVLWVIILFNIYCILLQKLSSEKN